MIGLYSRYGPPDRWRPLTRDSSPSGYPAEPLVSYQINRQLSGWILPPQVIRAFGAHCQQLTSRAASLTLLLVHQLDIVELPRLVEICLLRPVEPEVREPAFSRNGLDPVLRLRGLCRAEVEIDRPLRIGFEVLPRRRVGCALIGDDRSARGVVVERDRPELDDGRIRRHPHAIGLAAVEPVVVLVL